MELSVIIPVHNGGEDFNTCLQALKASTLQPDEIIVVDDGSTDTTAQIARGYGAKVLVTGDRPLGPAIARNRGTTIARGNILFFIDADVAVHKNTLQLACNIMKAHPEVTALFGSYDDMPAKPGIVSSYKNLQHHYVHQTGQREASTFWAGCGAIRRDAFIDLNGFNEDYFRPSVEDIELGMRLKRSNHHIWLCPEVQATHLKHWTFSNLLRADIFYRAIPWTKLILSYNQLPYDLNLDIKSRFSVIGLWLLIAFFVAGFFYPPAWLGMLVCVTILFFLNFGFYRLVANRKGLFTSIVAIFLHWLYYMYSSLVFGVMWLGHLFHKTKISLFARSMD